MKGRPSMQMLCNRKGCPNPAVVLYCSEACRQQVEIARAAKKTVKEIAVPRIDPGPIVSWPICPICRSLNNSGDGFIHVCPIGRG